jgi:pilus assembly protein CpaC
LEVRAEVSEIDTSLTLGTGVPGFRVRRVNTGVRMKSGHTLALAGDYREETETEKRGLPFLMDSPIWGALFRRTSDTTQESELVFLITPRFASEVDPTMVPRLGPGQLTDSPSRHELYTRGYVEVPRCNDDCPIHDRFDDPANQSYPNYPAQLNQHQQNTEPGVPVQGSNYRQPGSGNPAPTGQFPVYQSNGSQPPANNGYGAGFGWPQGK